MKHKYYWKTSKLLSVASLSAGIKTYQSPDLTLGTNEVSGSQTAGKFQSLQEMIPGSSVSSLRAWLWAILYFMRKGKVLGGSNGFLLKFDFSNRQEF